MYAIKYSVYFMLYVYVVSPFVQYLSRSLRLPIPCKVSDWKKKVVVTSWHLLPEQNVLYRILFRGGGKLRPMVSTILELP
jgi:hypothetical protein